MIALRWLCLSDSMVGGSKRKLMMPRLYWLDLSVNVTHHTPKAAITSYTSTGTESWTTKKHAVHDLLVFMSHYLYRKSKAQ